MNSDFADLADVEEFILQIKGLQKARKRKKKKNQQEDTTICDIEAVRVLRRHSEKV
jgi:hypothetical protein